MSNDFNLKEKKGYRKYIKDMIIVGVFLILAILNIIFNIKEEGFSSIADIFEQVILLLLAFTGLIEIFHYVGWDIFVPNFMLFKKKEERINELKESVNNIIEYTIDDLMAKSMDKYFRKEANFIKDYSEQRVEFVMSQLGINAEQFNSIRLELIKMRCLPLKEIQDAETKIKQFIKCGYPMIVDLTQIDPAKRTYKDVDYYLNFNDAMYIDDSCRELAQAMHLLICKKVGVDNFDRLVIPYDSNTILGVEVGKLLGKPVVKMRRDMGRVQYEQRWDGTFNPGDRILILHDVLVSGDQILHIPINIPKSCSTIGLCCLATRTEGSGLKLLQDENIKVFRILDISDSDIKKILNLV